MTDLKTIERDVLGTEYVVVAVTSTADPLTDTVQVALIPRGTTTDPDWLNAAWAPNQTWAAGKAVNCRVLIGPDGGAATLTKGVTYTVKVRVTDNPETPVFSAYKIKGV